MKSPREEEQEAGAARHADCFWELVTRGRANKLWFFIFLRRGFKMEDNASGDVRRRTGAFVEKWTHTDRGYVIFLFLHTN